MNQSFDSDSVAEFVEWIKQCRELGVLSAELPGGYKVVLDPSFTPRPTRQQVQVSDLPPEIEQARAKTAYETSGPDALYDEVDQALFGGRLPPR